jgi:hypothetical protein
MAKFTAQHLKDHEWSFNDAQNKITLSNRQNEHSVAVIFERLKSNSSFLDEKMRKLKHADSGFSSD